MTPTRKFPIPTTISAQAQAALAAPSAPAPVYPPLDDTEGWLTMIAETDSFITSFLGGVEFPVTSDKKNVSGVPVYEIRSHEVPADQASPILLEIHGGGLMTGGGDATRLLGSYNAAIFGMTVWAVDYRMPPLHPYPAALDDCMTVYRELLEAHRPEDIFVGGGSAGGNLAAALLLRAKDEGLPMPAALLLRTPEIDLTESGDSFVTLDGVNDGLRSLMPVNLLYAGGHDLTHPYLSPLFGDFTGFPPTFVQGGTRDLYLSNSILIHRKLRAAGVEAELHVFEAMPHQGFGGSPEDQDMAAEMRRFLDKYRTS
ncbi:alpha/beta hydrolase [Cryobacterium sp. AP23]